MEENYLTEGSFKASIDSLIDSKFGEGYTLQDVGELVELTEMTLEDRMELMTKTIDKDFEDMSKSLDNLQKSLYDMLDLLTDSQVDLKDSAEHGGITDADIQKIVDGLKLEEKFFPHLYQYLDERFGLNEEKIKNFRSRTEKVIDADLGEVPVGDEREGRTESTAKINRELDKDRDKKAGKKAFEDQAVFNTRLKLWTEGHKEPSKQGDDKDDKKDRKKDDESLLSKIVKIGMIAGMIVEILKNSPELVNTVKDIFTGENGLFPRLQKVLDDLKLGDKIASAFQGVKEWFKEEFKSVTDMISQIYNFVEGTYYAMMSPSEQQAYAESNPESDLALWRKAGGGELDIHDVGQYKTAFSGERGDLLRSWDKEGKLSKLSQYVDVEDYADSFSGGRAFYSALTDYYKATKEGMMSKYDFARWLSLVPFDTFEMFTLGTENFDATNFLIDNYGMTYEWKKDPVTGIRNKVVYSNVKGAIDKFTSEVFAQHEKTVENQKKSDASIVQTVSEVRSSGAPLPTVPQVDARTKEEEMLDMGSTEHETANIYRRMQEEKKYGGYSDDYSGKLNIPGTTSFKTTGDYVEPKYMGTVVQINNYNAITKLNVGNGESRFHTTN